ncbi:MAG TPA: hypothetical protein VM841_02855 [Actinomycetota bacterium]|nr:hypothetical protein [Actinomycetota bacterium]
MRLWRWWSEVRRRRPILVGAVFWLVFWSVSATAMIWVYSPGGLGDPDRDLRRPSERISRPACVEACDAVTNEDSQPVAAGAGSSGSQRTSGSWAGDDTRISPTPRPGVPRPSLPSIRVPEVSVEVSDVLMIAGSRYLKYVVTVSANDVDGELLITTSVPDKTWFVECTDQAGQQVCTDSFRGADDDHRVVWRQAVGADRKRTLNYLVRLDQFAMPGQEIRNHAHVVWDDKVVSSAPDVFTVPPLIGS